MPSSPTTIPSTTTVSPGYFADIGGFEIFGIAADGRQAVHIASTLLPDVVLMDLRMPVLDGIEATRQITSGNPNIGVVVLTMFDEDDLVYAAVRAGARGYLLEDDDDEQIARVIHGIGRGEAIFGPRTANDSSTSSAATPHDHRTPDHFHNSPPTNTKCSK